MKQDRAARESKIRARYRTLQWSLRERARRLFVASEAIALGYGGIVAAARATRMVPSVIGRGVADIRVIEAGTAPSLPPTRSRRPGGGRKKATEKGRRGGSNGYRCACGSWSSEDSSTNSASPSPSVICRQGRASGTRSSTACSRSSRRTTPCTRRPRHDEATASFAAGP